jgi:alpha,alpha-trehalose-phosphate synthase [UDP-forming]
MTRLVAVSNRLPGVKPAPTADSPAVPVGGLASALFGVLRERPGSLWLGWTGKVAAPGRERRLRESTIGGVGLLGIAMTQEEVDEHYLGFCNKTLWPLLHCFQGKVEISRREEDRYRAVQARFANALRPLLRADDRVWVHDYHLLRLGRELRRLGWQGRLGFFLHTPFPPLDLWEVLPDAHGLLDAMLDYDVVGFHTRGYLHNYVHACGELVGVRWDGSSLAGGARRQRVGVYPVGIDPAPFRPDRQVGATGGREHVLRRHVRRRRVILGVDRLDYTKGIPERLLAYENFLHRYPEWRKKVVLMQIAAPSRAEVAEYADQRARIESLMGRINGELGEPDWVPLRYLYRTYPREFLARLYAEADVGLVTPLRDGMNLVAKEFVASQDPDAPGVLVLSRLAGAAEQMSEAVIVNPYDPADVAAGIGAALAMPSEERRARHAALLRRVLRGTAAEWGRRFVADLDGRPRGAREHLEEAARSVRPALP